MDDREKQVSFNRGRPINSEPDYDFWSKKDVWLLPEAAKVICGRDPVSRYPGRPHFNRQHKVVDIVDIAFAAVRAGDLEVIRDALIPIHVLVQPQAFLKWAVNSGYEVPQPLVAAQDTQVQKNSERDIQIKAQAIADTLMYFNSELKRDELQQHPIFVKLLGVDFPGVEKLTAWLESPQS